jgi:hypothetical protein
MELGDTLKNNASPASWRCHRSIDRQYQIHPSRRLTSGPRPQDKAPHLASGIARLLFGAATLKSAQQGRDSACFTVPKKAFHSRASDSRLHPRFNRFDTR